MRARRLGLLAALGALAATMAPLRAAPDDDEIKVSARLEPQTIAPDGFALLQVEIVGAGFGRLRAAPTFEVENFDAPGSASRSESFEFVNGETRRSLTLSWRLRPLAEGAARVHHLKVELGEQVVELPDLAVTVDRDAASRNAPGPGTLVPSPFRLGDPFADLFGPRPRRRPLSTVTPKVLLRATVAPERVVAGEQAIYTVRLYTQGDVSAIQPIAVPRFDRFWAREMPTPERPRAEMVELEGERYGTVVLLQRALFPLRPGLTRIEPFRAAIAVRLPSADPWGRLVGEVETWRRESNAVELTVDPLPPAPPDVARRFSGAVGRLKLDATLEPAAVEVGEASTLTVTLVGPGRLEGVADPPLPRLEGVRAFPPQSEGGDELRGSTVVGRRVWRHVLVPETAGTWTVPPIAFTYFDPVQRAYREAASPPLSLSAAAPAAVAPGATTAEAAAEPVEPPANRRSWSAVAPWLLAAALALALTVVLARRRAQDRRQDAARPGLPADPAFRERLEAALLETRPRSMAGAVEDLFRAEFERRHALPPATPAAQWAARLGTNGFTPEMVDDIRRLAEELHYLRYAPQLSSTESVRADLGQRARRLASRLA